MGSVNYEKSLVDTLLFSLSFGCAVAVVPAPTIVMVSVTSMHTSVESLRLGLSIGVWNSI